MSGLRRKSGDGSHQDHPSFGDVIQDIGRYFKGLTRKDVELVHLDEAHVQDLTKLVLARGFPYARLTEAIDRPKLEEAFRGVLYGPDFFDYRFKDTSANSFDTAAGENVGPGLSFSLRRLFVYGNSDITYSKIKALHDQIKDSKEKRGHDAQIFYPQGHHRWPTKKNSRVRYSSEAVAEKILDSEPILGLMERAAEHGDKFSVLGVMRIHYPGDWTSVPKLYIPGVSVDERNRIIRPFENKLRYPK